MEFLDFFLRAYSSLLGSMENTLQNDDVDTAPDIMETGGEAATAISAPAKSRHRSYFKQVGNNLIIEWRIFKKPIVFSWIIVGCIMQWVHNIAHNYVYYLAGQYGVYGGPEDQLTDLGFEAFPDWSNLKFLPSNGCLYSLGIIAFVIAVSPIFSLGGNRCILRSPKISSVQILWRALICVSVAVVFRCVSFLITILPAPAPQCAEATFNPPNTVSEILFHFDTENGCSDLIFSSHMMYGLTAVSIVTLYIHLGLKDAKESGYAVGKWEKRSKVGLIVFCWLLVLMEGFSIICQERHYSIDVWNALYVVPMIWIVFYHFYPTDPAAFHVSPETPS